MQHYAKDSAARLKRHPLVQTSPSMHTHARAHGKNTNTPTTRLLPAFFAFASTISARFRPSTSDSAANTPAGTLLLSTAHAEGDWVRRGRGRFDARTPLINQWW